MIFTETNKYLVNSILYVDSININYLSRSIITVQYFLHNLEKGMEEFLFHDFSHKYCNNRSEWMRCRWPGLEEERLDTGFAYHEEVSA